MPYLKEVIADVLENYPNKIERLVFVTTGKRPALFLKKHFAEQVKHVTIAPEFIGIADLFTRISGVQPISTLPLLFEFYDCYTKVHQEQYKDTPDTFEEFLSWGQTALNMGVGYLAHLLKGREGILIILLTTLLVLGGTSFGLAEETLAFYPMLVPIFLAAGYDLIVPLAVIYIGSNVGSMASTTNPFAVIIASDAAGVDWTSGLYVRLTALVLCVLISIIYIIRYAEKVKKHPEKSIVYGVALPEIYASNTAEKTTTLKLSTKIELLVFALSFIVMIVGVSQWEWWFGEMTALFLVAAIAIAVLQRCGEEAFVQHFIAGARDLLGVAFIIGIARGVSFILNDGQISGTILHYATDLVQGMSPILFLPMLMLIFGVLSLFIASSSGMAVLTMPIIGSLASVVGVEGHSVVSAYLFGMGVMALITPTGLILPSLAMVNVNYRQWLRFCMPLVLIFTVVLMVLLLITNN